MTCCITAWGDIESWLLLLLLMFLSLDLLLFDPCKPIQVNIARTFCTSFFNPSVSARARSSRDG